MPITAANYDRARAILDDPELAEEKRAALAAQVQAYENSRQTAGLPQFGMQTSAEAMEKTELEFPRPAAAAKSGAVAPVADDEDLTPEQQYDRERALAGKQDQSYANRVDFDEALPSASKLKHLYADPEFMPGGGSFQNYATATYFYEPPLELAKEAEYQRLKREGKSEYEAGQAVLQMSEESDEYKKFADALWKETYESAGKPAVRVKYMNTDTWGKKLAYGQAKALEAAAPLAYGADRTLTGGIVSEAISGALESEPGRRARQAQQDASPIASGAGAVVGALSPGGLTSRIYGGLSRKMAGEGATMGTRLAASVGAGAGTGAAESLISDTVHNLGEKAFTDDPRYISPGQMGDRALSSGTMGAALGPVGEIIGTGAGKAVRALREGRRGPAMANAEEAGMVGPMGLTKPGPIRDIESAAAIAKRRPRDVMTEDVADPMAATALKRQSDTVEGIEGENWAYYKTPQGREAKPLYNLAGQVLKEIDDLTVQVGGGKPLAGAGESREALRRLVPDLLDIELVPAAQARGGTSFEGGGSQAIMRPSEIDVLGAVVPELAAKAWKAAGGKAPSAIPPGFVYRLTPTKLSARQLDKQVQIIDELSEAAGRGPNPYKRLQKAVRMDRDQFSTEGTPLAGGTPMRLADGTVVRGWSAVKARQEAKLHDVEAANQQAGLPKDLPRGRSQPVVEGEAPALPRPDMSEAQWTSFRDTIAKYRSAPNREAQDKALEKLAVDSGKLDELKRLAGTRAFDELKEAGSVRAFFGSEGQLSLYSGKPLEVLQIRGDPLARGLSKAAPKAAPISEDLMGLVKALANPKRTVSALRTSPLSGGKLDPLKEINIAPGRGSARQLGPAAAAGERKKKSYKVSDLSREEARILLRLVEQAQLQPQQAASGE